jgi:Protein of unknown function (DUF1073)
VSGFGTQDVGSGFASPLINGSALGSSLETLLLADDITPGALPSYELCKVIYLTHPLGAKMAETPIKLAQSQQRTISISVGPEDRLREAFLEERKRMRADFHIYNTMVQARVYGISTLVVGAVGKDVSKPLDPWKLADETIYLSTFDPLNTAGSLVLNQNPNDPNFQKVVEVSAGGLVYHRSRSAVVMNEAPIYIAYTTSGFGYVGRSVYQRALFPLKSFVQTMIADDMVARKVGLIIAKMKAASSVVDWMMQKLAGVKRILLRRGQTNQVLGITPEEEIESLDLKNLEGPLKLCRTDILENIATATPMPAKLITQETFAEGFGEGEEDAKYVAHYIDGVREGMAPLYDFTDDIAMFRAWNPEFYGRLQKEFSEYRKIDYKTAFYAFKNSFSTSWPSLLTEPESELIKVDDTRFKAVIAMLEVLLPTLDPENVAEAIQWAVDNFNERKRLISSPLNLDPKTLAEFLAKKQKDAEDATKQVQAGGAGGPGGAEPTPKEPAAPPPFAKAA